MALKAEILTRFEKIVFVVRRVGIVAKNTFAFRHNFVLTFSLGRHDIVVALVTYGLLVTVKEAGIDSRMGVMAASAFSFGQWRMHGCFFQHAFEICVAFKAKLSTRPRTQMQCGILCIPATRFFGMARLTGALCKWWMEHGLEEFRIL